MMQPQTPLQQLIDSIIGQIKRGENQAALISLDRQLKKDKFNKSEKKQLLLMKGTILVQMGSLGEASKILQEGLQDNIEPEQHIMFSNLAKDLGMMDQFFLKFKANNSELVKEQYNLYIQNHNFAEASKLALKIYKDEGEKHHETMMEYLILSSQKEDMGGKFTELFLDKLSKLIKLENNLKECTNQELGAQLVKFQLKFYQNVKNKNVAKVQQILDNYGALFVEYQQNADIALWIYQNDPSQKNYEQVLIHHYAVYNSLKTDQILINFDCQEQLVKAFYDQNFNFVIQEVDEPFRIVPQNELLSHIYNSCQLLLKTVKNSLAIKQLVLISLKILNLAPNPNIQEVLKLVIQFYHIQGDKYTFCTELFKAIPKIKIHKQIYETLTGLNFEFKSNEAKTIAHINLKKIEIFISEQPIQFIEELLKLYNQFPVPQKVEKGDRLLQDEYLMMAIDILYDVNNTEYIIRSLDLINLGLRNSPYNFDFLFRQILLLSELGLVEQTVESLTRLDIKGVQFDTLGFLFAKAFLEFGGPLDQVERKNQQALMFYLENIRESKKNLLSSFKMKNYVPFESFYQFEDWINNSYVKLIYYYVQSQIYNERSKQEVNIQYFSNLIQQKLNSSLTLSIHEAHFQNYFIREFDSGDAKFNNYLGIYQNNDQFYLEVLFLNLNNQLSHLLSDFESAPDVLGTINKIVQQKQIMNGNFQLSTRNQLNNQPLKSGYLDEFQQFIDAEREFRLVIASFYTTLYVTQNEMTVNNYQLDLSNFKKLSNLLKALKFESIPTNSIRIIYRFYKQTFPAIILLTKSSSELKQRLFVLQKKAKGEIKQAIEKLHKSITQTITVLKEEIFEISVHLIKSLSSVNPQQTMQTIIDKKYGENLTTSLHFLNVSVIQLIEERSKLLK